MSDCILWEKGRTNKGYGATRRDGKQVTVHRLAYEEAYGPIPEGMCVLHRCDVRHCHNPDHLFLGTKADNSRDMASKGRAARGERNGNAKLTEDSARAIRDLYRQGGISQERVAERYGVSQALVSLIVNERMWKCATG